MNAKQIFDFLEFSNKLKETKRWIHTPKMKFKESSADHSWHLALLVMLVAEADKLDLDVLRAIKIALVHDMGEIIAGDTDSSLIYTGQVKKDEKYAAELAGINAITSKLPGDLGHYVFDLWDEYEKAETVEGKFVKALDKIEGIAQMLFQGKDTFDHPDWIAPHPNKAVADCPEVRPLLVELHRRLKPLYLELGWEWKEIYEG